MRFGTSDHTFNIHNVQLIIIFISLTKIKDIVENLDELCFQCSCASMFTYRRRLGHMFLTIPFNMFYYIPLKYGNFVLETLDTFRGGVYALLCYISLSTTPFAECQHESSYLFVINPFNFETTR
jgi:hypothetical protein